MKPEHNPIFSLVGRIMIAALFIPAGVSKLFGFQGVVNFVAAAGLPQPQLAAVIAIAVEIPLGFALLVGWQTRKVAAVLAAFTLIATMSFHPFWAVPEAQQMIQHLMFWKNIAIVGGLLMVASLGGGAGSVDTWRSARQAAQQPAAA